MNYLVIGHLCYDEVHRAKAPVETGFGGIYYSVGALAAVAGADHTIHPVFGVGQDRAEELFAALAAFPNVSTEGIYTFEGPTNTVKLFPGEGQERIECSEHIAEPIPVAKVQPYVRRADAVLINMISGFDITFDVLYMIQEQRKTRNVPIYFDLHSMTLGVDDDNRRYRRPIMDWRRWVFHTTFVQMNEAEAAGLTVEQLTEEQLAKLMMSLGPSAMIVTRGSRGAGIYTAEKKKVIFTDISGIPAASQRRDGALDSAGCGDVFGAACLFRYTQTPDIVEAARFANRVAARKASMVRSADLGALAGIGTDTSE